MTVPLMLNSNCGKYQIFIVQIDPILANVSFGLSFENVAINSTSIAICISILEKC